MIDVRSALCSVYTMYVEHEYELAIQCPLYQIALMILADAYDMW
jgi:hypothetical protein